MFAAGQGGRKEAGTASCMQPWAMGKGCSHVSRLEAAGCPHQPAMLTAKAFCLGDKPGSRGKIHLQI